jgi:uncharacterized membrane protein
MTAHELLDLLFRWVHVIAGIMWIGNSMLFNWLDRNLIRPAEKAQRPGFEGEIWLVHSGGFYQVEKKQLQPHELPPALHWFKWQNGFTWLSGMGLLVVVYYHQAAAFMVDPEVARLAAGVAIAVSIALLLAAWLVYDVLWLTFADQPRFAAALSFALLGLAAWALAHLFSGRAAFIHVGVILGTLMTGNVWLHILPSQRELIAATREGRPQRRALAELAKQRSIHNNYMTFPLLFTMISNHFPATYGSKSGWIVLAVLMAAGAAVRHLMNIRFGLPRVRAWLAPALAVVAVAAVAVFLLTARPAPAAAPPGPVPSFAAAAEVIGRRCQPCHSAHPSDRLFPAAPSGVMFDSPDQMRRMAARIRERAVVTRTMPFANRTEITEAERDLLARWIAGGAPVGP